MLSINRLHYEIARIKETLKKSPMIENFGQKELRKLKDKYELQIESTDQIQIRIAIIAFGIWCETYEGI